MQYILLEGGRLVTSSEETLKEHVACDRGVKNESKTSNTKGKRQNGKSE